MPKRLGKALEDALGKSGGQDEGRRGEKRRTREKVLVFLTYRPFSNKTSIAEALGVTPKTVSWHLDKLMDKGFVSASGRLFYPIQLIHPQDMELAILFSKKETRTLFSMASKHPGATMSELAEKGGIGHSMASELAKDLEAQGAISRVKDGRNVRLYPTDLMENKNIEYGKNSKHFTDHISRLLTQENIRFEARKKGETFVAILEEGVKKRSLIFNTNPFKALTQEELPPVF